MNVLRQILAWLPVFGMLMLISSLPYGWTLYQKISIFVLGISTGLYYLSEQQWLKLRWDRSKWVFLCLLVVYALLPIRQLFDPTPMTDYVWHQLHLNEWFLYIGLAGLVGFTPKLKIEQVAYVMLATGVVIGAQLLYLYFGTTEMTCWAPQMRIDYLRRTYINSHMVINLFINVGLVFALLTLQKEKSLWKRSLLIIGMILNWLVVLTSNGRIGIVGSVIIMLAGGFYGLYQTHRLRVLWFVIPILAAGIWLALQNPRLDRRYIDKDPRGGIWSYSWQMIQERPIFGYGPSTLSVEFVEGMYDESAPCADFIRLIQADSQFVQQGKTMRTHHPHNAFLMCWLAYGIIGVLALVLLFVAAACLPVGDKRIYLWLVLMVILLQCLTEPIGDHLRPLFITVILWVCQLTLCEYQPSILDRKL